MARTEPGLTDEELEMLRRLQDKQRAAEGDGGSRSREEAEAAAAAAAMFGGVGGGGSGGGVPGASGGMMMRSKGWPWATILICAAWIIVYTILHKTGDAGGVSMNDLDRAGGLNNQAIRGGEWWRLVTAAFLNASIVSLLFNVWFMFIAGKTMEMFLGSWGVVLYFLITGAGGGLVVVFNNGTSQLASDAATFGVIGALMGLYFRHKSRLPNGAGRMFFGFLPLIVIYVIMTAMGYAPGDPNELFGGMLVGVAAGFLLPGMGMFSRGARSSKRAPAWKRLALPVLLTGIIVLAWARVLFAGSSWGGVTTVEYVASDGRWSAQVPASFEASERGSRRIDFGNPSRGRTFRVQLDRELVNARIGTIRERLARAYSNSGGRTERITDLPLANSTWIALIENKPDGGVRRVMASELSAGMRGMVLIMEAPAHEAEIAVEELNIMAGSLRAQE